MAVNFANRRPKTGRLEGAYVTVVGSNLIGTKTFGPQATADEVLGNAVIGTILGSPFDAPTDELTAIEYKARRRMGMAPAGFTVTTGGTYKARPLNGIWATAPYLHNGSVPTLHHLLLPAKDRPKTFPIGSREYDPENVGLNIAIELPGGTIFRARADDGTAIPGNSNAGHEFGTAAITDPATRLDDAERRALLEYLKSL